jgi:YVTN family beta-propeller protein
MDRALSILFVIMIAGCRGSSSSPRPTAVSPLDASARVDDDGDGGSATAGATLPLVLVADVDLPGASARFDYQDFDVAHGHLVIAHMNDASVVVVNTSDGSLAKLLTGIPTPRGVAVAREVGRIFVTSLPNKLVVIDSATLAETARVDTGKGPDGVAWDPVHSIVATSDQSDGAISFIANAGSGARTQVRLGTETGNVVFDASRAVFWITVVSASRADQLVAVDPVTAKVTRTLALPGCSGAHGLRLHPDGKSAFVACEGNSKIARVDLDGAHTLDVAASGADPDVLAIDPGLGWLYVASESGDLVVFDIMKPGLVAKSTEHPGNASHSVAVDPATHRVFFPLIAGAKGTPVLRIMRPTFRTAPSSPPPPPRVEASTPALPALPASADAARTWTFDGDAIGQAPAGFSFGRTGDGAEGKWLVRAEPGAPSGANVLAQTDADPEDNRFPVAWANEPSLRDLDLRVRCKPISGKIDRACGLVFRLRDAKNYYVTRANALEGNVRLYYVKDCKRHQIASSSGKVTSNVWHDYRVVVRGDHVEVHWDGAKVIDHNDATFSEAGKIGLWTKADSVTYFDDLSVTQL